MATFGNSAGSRTAVWVIILLLIVGLAGFGATNFGGNVNAVGKVGERDISALGYSRALQTQMQQLSQQTGQNVTFAQLQAVGMDQAILQQLVSVAALENEAAMLGLSAGDMQVRDQILRTTAFQGLDGQFDREAYGFALERSGLSEREYESDLRAEISRTILQGAVAGGVPGSKTYADAIYNFVGETRDFGWVALTAADLTEPVAEPSEDDLATYFAENEDNYMLPETREVTYAWLTPEMAAETITVDDAILEEIYQSRIDEFVLPERRLVERLILGDAADDAKARLDAGEITFEELVAERELELSDIDLGDVSKTDLGDAAEAVFALTEPGIAGPAETDLGPALFRVNAIIGAQETSFEDAKADLTTEYALEEAANAIAVQIEDIDDLLAGGATLEELAAETDMELGQISFTADSSDGPAQYSVFRQTVSATNVGDFPEIQELEDGGIFAMRVNEVIEPRVEDYEIAKPRVTTDWTLSETSRLLSEMAEAKAAELRDGKSTDELGLVMTIETAKLRTDFVPDAPIDMMIRVFELEDGGIASVPAPTSAVIVQLNAISGPDPENTQLASQRDQLEQATARDIGADILAAFSNRIELDAGIVLDQAALNAVHTHLP